MPKAEIQSAHEQLSRHIAEFEQQNPAVVEAMRVMQISFSQYLLALASLKGESSTSSNASSST